MTARVNRYLPVLAALVAVLLLAGLLRLWNIQQESFWADEGWTMQLAKGPTIRDVVLTMADDQHPPLYFVILNSWISLVGNSPFSARLPSLFWSLIGICCAYRVGAVLFSREAGLGGALLLALQDNDIMLSQDARHYTQVAALAVGSTLFYLLYVKTPHPKFLPHAGGRNFTAPARPSGGRGWGMGGNGFLWFACSVLMMYTHYLGAFILLIQALHAVIIVRPFRRIADVWIRLALITLAWTPWAFVFLGQSLVRYQRPELFQSTLPNTRAAFDIVLGDLFGHQAGLTVAVLLLGLVWITYHDRARIVPQPLIGTLYLLLWLVVPFAVIVAINPRFPIMTTRNFLLITPPILILIGHGLTNLDRFARRLILAVFVVVALTTVDAYHIKPGWRDIAHTLLAYRVGNDPIIMDVWVEDFSLRYHLGQWIAPNVRPDASDQLPLISMRDYRGRYREDYFAYTKAFLSDKSDFWLPYYEQNKDGLLEWFNGQGFVQTGSLAFNHVGDTIWLYRYDRADLPVLTTFGNLFRLHKAEYGRNIDGELTVNLVWSISTATPLDYSVSVIALNRDGTLIAQHDSSPMNGASPTSSWSPDTLKFDTHILDLPPDRITSGDYTIGVRIYFYADPQPLKTESGSDFYPVGP